MRTRRGRHRFSAFWLRSSVVSVLISLISDTSASPRFYINLIFGHSAFAVLARLRARMAPDDTTPVAVHPFEQSNDSIHSLVFLLFLLQCDACDPTAHILPRTTTTSSTSRFHSSSSSQFKKWKQPFNVIITHPHIIQHRRPDIRSATQLHLPPPCPSAC